MSQKCQNQANSSVQTSMNDHGVRYNLYHNESASVIPTILY